MTREGGGDPNSRRERRRNQLHEAGAPTLALGLLQPPADPAAEGEGETPHYHGHRERLRSRLREAGPGALADYELLELILFRAIPRRDVKPLAKSLIARFGSFAETIAAAPERLAEVEGMSAGAVSEFFFPLNERSQWLRADFPSDPQPKSNRRDSDWLAAGSNAASALTTIPA